MNTEQILSLIKATPGLSDREITDRLLGPNQPQQSANGLCRILAQRSVIARIKRDDGIIGNYVGAEYNPVNTSSQKASATTQFEIPLDLIEKARELGQLWAESPLRPKLKPEVVAHWDELIEAWTQDLQMPLLVRKQGVGRGLPVVHEETKRTIIQTDNSPAQWAFDCAQKCVTPSLDDVRQMLKDFQVPLVFTQLQSCGVNLGKKGWKLCHITPVGLKSRTGLKDLKIRDLEDRFRWLLKPSNQFLVPLKWSGLGEIPEVIAAIRSYEAQTHEMN